jgi:hypothetical protein
VDLARDNKADLMMQRPTHGHLARARVYAPAASETCKSLWTPCTLAALSQEEKSGPEDTQWRRRRSPVSPVLESEQAVKSEPSPPLFWSYGRFRPTAHFKWSAFALHRFFNFLSLRCWRENWCQQQPCECRSAPVRRPDSWMLVGRWAFLTLPQSIHVDNQIS